MKYKRGNINRIFIAKTEHGDDLLKEIKTMAEKENIKSGFFFMLGALEGAHIVSGPQECTVPPEPIEVRFNDGREVLGMGSIFRNNCDEPVIHVHGVFGRGRDTLMGCLRRDSKVYLVMEIILFEVSGTGAFKEIDDSGLGMLNFGG